ncbi:MAG TPA: DUF2752 domain-containing protein [Actinomycetota bacterium]|nr:DUF2752 domain-containing protein [Actinomycetota bacterium]
MRESTRGRVAALRAWTGSVALDVADLRIAGLVLCAAALVLPMVPFYPGVTCPLRASTGIPCPLCGITTSVRATMRLDAAEAVATNPGGFAAVGAAAALLVMRRPRITVPVAAVPLGFVCLWVFELFRFNLL